MVITITISQELMLDHLTRQAAMHGLTISGAFHPAPTDPSLAKTLILLSPNNAFWDVFKNSHEYIQGQENPIDKWSKRVITALAEDVSATPKFPFGGPPFSPFLDWAKQSGRAFSSPLGMLVHDTYGMMISYRGALAFDRVIHLTKQTTQSPCNTCADKPCLTACPVNAITDAGYDVGRCHQYLDTNAGETCMTQACQIRTACPVSVAVKRDFAHNLLHMRAFKGET